MLEFVHLTADGDGKDQQTRRKVRSQAMRDFRRRQREAKDEAEQGRRMSSSAAPSSTLSHQLLERSSSDVGPSLKGGFRRKSVQDTGSKQNPPPSHEPLFSVMPLSSPPIPQSTSSSPRPSGQWMQSARPRHHRAPSEPIRSQNASSQSPSLAQHEDYFDSPAQIAQMLQFCRSYLHWLEPYADSETLNRVTADAWESSKSQMLLAACCLASVGHLDAVQPNRPTGNYATYKGRILRELSQRVQNPITAIADETIGTLACLMSFELSKGSAEATTHLRGLANVVGLRGGLESVGSNGKLATMVECLDLVHGIMCDSKPLIARADPGTLASISESNPELSDVETFERLLPLLIAEHEELQAGYQTARNIHLQQVGELLRGAAAALRGTSLSNTAQDFLLFGSDPIRHFQDRLDAFGQSTVAHGTDVNDDTHYLVRAANQSLVLFSNLAINKIPYRHISNQQNVRMLCEATRHVKDTSWQGLTYLRLWILVTGLAASTEQDVRTFLKAQLVRASYHTSITSNWRRAKHFLLRFVEMKTCLERPSRRATPPVEDFGPPRPSGSFAASGPTTTSAGTGQAGLPYLTPYLSRAPSQSSHAESSNEEWTRERFEHSF